MEGDGRVTLRMDQKGVVLQDEACFRIRLSGELCVSST